MIIYLSKYMPKLTPEEEIASLYETIRKLNAKRYRRFNVQLKKEIFDKLDGTAKREGISKAKCLSKMIGNYV